MAISDGVGDEWWACVERDGRIMCGWEWGWVMDAICGRVKGGECLLLCPMSSVLESCPTSRPCYITTSDSETDSLRPAVSRSHLFPS
jgi:hypothetical protein